MSGKRFAAIDIGTNSLLLLIAELHEDQRFEILEDLAEVARLGQGVDRSVRISPQGEGRTLEVLCRFVDRCKSLGVDEIVAVGTSALRDARNSSEVRARFQRKLGLEIRVLSGDQEAAYSFLAVRKGLQLSGRELLVVDVGGGSTEFIFGNEGGVYRSASLNIGSVRLTERFLHADPVRPEECVQMVTVIDDELRSLRHRWARESSALTMVGIAATFTSLVAIEKRLARYSHSEVHGSPLMLAEVRRQVKLFQSKSVADRQSIPGLEPKRADVILAGAYLVERIMTLFDCDRLIVSDQGVRYGLLYERLEKHKNTVDISR